MMLEISYHVMCVDLKRGKVPFCVEEDSCGKLNFEKTNCFLCPLVNIFVYIILKQISAIPTESFVAAPHDVAG